MRKNGRRQLLRPLQFDLRGGYGKRKGYAAILVYFAVGNFLYNGRVIIVYSYKFIPVGQDANRNGNTLRDGGYRNGVAVITVICGGDVKEYIACICSAARIAHGEGSVGGVRQAYADHVYIRIKHIVNRAVSRNGAFCGIPQKPCRYLINAA